MNAPGRTLPNPVLTQWVIYGLAVLLLGAVLGIHFYQERVEIERRESERLIFMTRIVFQITDRNLTSLNLVLRDLCEHTVRGEDSEDIRHRLETLAQALAGVRTLVIIDADGIIRTSSRPQLIGRPSIQGEHLQYIRQNPDPELLYISPPYKTQLGAFSINISRLIAGPNGSYNGIVSATLDPAFFAPLMQSVLYAPDMWATMVHANGDMFLMVPEREGVAGKNLAQPGTLFTRHRESGNDCNVFTGKVYLTGETRILAARTLVPAGVKVDKPLVIGISSDIGRVFGNWRKELSFQGLVFLALVTISSLVLFAFQKRQRVLDRRIAEATRTLVENERFLRTFTNNIPALAAYWDKDLKCVYANSAYTEWFGWTPERMRGVSIRQVLGEDIFSKNEPYIRAALRGEPQRFERTLVKADGSTGYTLARYIPDIVSGQVRGFFVLVSDITELKITQGELEQRVQELDILASTDPLTGINNRRHFLARMGEELVRTTRYGLPLVMLMLDIDHFKAVNDAHGHDAGDEVLKSLVSVLLANLRGTDLIGRLGGEEFGVLLIQTGIDEALIIAERLRAAFEETVVEAKGKHIRYTVSIGLAEYLGSADNSEDIMKRADVALYRAKGAGRNRVRCFGEQ